MSDDRRELTPVTILDRAVTANATPEVIEKLMGLQERWEHHRAKQAFEEALAGVELPPILKNIPVDQGRGPKYKYEDLAEICKLVDPVLKDHGLHYRWRTQSNPDRTVTVTCILSHKWGYSEESSLTAPPDTTGAKNPVQSVGSTVSYLQRYTLKAALGVAAEKDDDGRGGQPQVPIDLPISSERAAEIRKLTDEANLDEERLTKMLNAVNAARIDEISDSHYERVVRWLTTTIEQNKQKKEEEQHEPE